MMKLARFLGLMAAILVLSPLAFADGNPVKMQFTGVIGANDGYYYGRPYTGMMNGQNVVLFCDDIKTTSISVRVGPPTSPTSVPS
jgi:hypothetical protein